VYRKPFLASVGCAKLSLRSPQLCGGSGVAGWQLGYNGATSGDANRHATGGNMLDLGIAGRKAIVCAASKGLGRACAMALSRAGVEVTITARTEETLEQTAGEIRAATGGKVTAVAGDITTEAGRAATLAACPEPDILVNNAGGPPHGDFRDWSIEDWQKAVNGNM